MRQGGDTDGQPVESRVIRKGTDRHLKATRRYLWTMAIKIGVIRTGVSRLLFFAASPA